MHPISNLEIAVKREKRFTRATLVDACGTEIGATLCDVRYLPEVGIQVFESSVIDVKQDSEGDCRLIIDQDPITDWHLVYRLGRRIRLLSTPVRLRVSGTRPI